MSCTKEFRFAIIVILSCCVFSAVSFGKGPKKSPPGKNSADLQAAKKRIVELYRRRLDAATAALENAVNAGLPVDVAENTMVEGFDVGLDAADFAPLGKRAAAFHAGGLKGKALADAVRREVRRRHQLRRRMKQQKQKKKGGGKGQGQGGGQGQGVGQGQGGGQGVGQGQGGGKGQGGGQGVGQGQGGGKGQGGGGGKGKGGAGGGGHGSGGGGSGHGGGGKDRGGGGGRGRR